ncbi:hypothetical protein OIV83_001383 [Microbotryomycetes sp. JL201]|nr:hypothetical protein OIV83_001383 [Microbotryomycetes sp. JL201]
MAQVMMRAMGVGSLTSSSTKDAHSGSGAAAASSPPGEGESLTRQASRLQTVYGMPAYNPQSILIKSPSIVQNTAAASDTESVNSVILPSPGLPTDSRTPSLASSPTSHSSAAHVNTSGSRARSLSRESHGRRAASPQPPIDMAPLSTSISNETGLVRLESYENRKIRFAPLPEITNREDDLDGERLSRTSSADNAAQSTHGAPSSTQDVDDGAPRSYGAMFGSWKSDTSFGGRRSADDQDDDENDDGRSRLSSSYTAKLLRPLGFGNNKKKKRSSSSTRSSGTESLSRQSSNESELSRTTSNIDGSRQPTGIPMRKTRTWESAEDVATSPRTSRKTTAATPGAKRPRASAIRRSKMSRSAPAAPDVEFNEWGSNQGVGSVRSTSAFQDGEEDDGSGMAWIRRRRAQREAEEKQKAEEEARRQREEEESRNAAEDDEADEEVERGDTDVPFALDEDAHSTRTAVPRADGGTERSTRTSTPLASNTPKQTSLSVQTQAGGLSMTRPDLRIHKATPDASPAVHSKPFDFAIPHSPLVQSESPLSSSPPRSIRAAPDDSVRAQDLSDKLGKLALAPRSRPHGPATYSDVESDSDEDSSSESDDDEDDDAKDDNDDSDLDEDEIAQEEALAEQARKTAQSAGAERFHSAKHQSSVVAVDKGRVAPSRQSTLTPTTASSAVAAMTPSRQNTVTPPRQASFS